MAKPFPMRGVKNMKGGPRPKAKKGTLLRLLKMLFSQNKALIISVLFCILISATT